MASSEKNAFVRVAVRRTPKLNLSPRMLMSLGFIHMLWGILELGLKDDAVFDLVVGGFYLVNGVLLKKLMKPAAWAVLSALVLFTPLYGFMVIANLLMWGEVKQHAKPMVLCVLGVLSIIDTVGRLRNWDDLKAQGRVTLTYQRSWNAPAFTWRVFDLAGIAAAIVVILIFMYLTDGGKQTGMVSSIVFCLVMGGVVVLVRVSNYRSRQYRALGAAAVLRHDERKPILLLRSFSDDMLVIRRGGGFPLSFYFGDMRGPTFEETITSQLAYYGPVLAIGRPGESLPLIGAAREYVSNEDWQRRVSSLVVDAAAIAVVVGTTKGLGWELHEMSERRVQGKVLLVLPPEQQRDRQSPEQRWMEFRDLAIEAGGWDLPRSVDLQKTLLIDVERRLLYEADSYDPATYAAALDKAVKVLLG